MIRIRGRQHCRPLLVLVLCSLSSLLITLLTLSSGRYSATAIVLLQDLPTPSFLIDLQAVQRNLGHPEAPIPPIALPSASCCLVPRRLPAKGDDLNQDNLDAPPFHPHTFDLDLQPRTLFVEDGTRTDTPPPTSSSNAAGEVCYGYIHTRVVQSRSEPATTTTTPATTTQRNKRPAADPPSTNNFLAQLDAITTDDVPAHLVLGLNNHHVVSYYWARSAGAGAAMETPGIVFDGRTGILQWESESGFTDCNSNDGKRSEWVNFLRVGDSVQLRPHRPEQALLCFLDSGRGIYGVSSAGRPLGSEPVVVCEWESLPWPS